MRKLRLNLEVIQEGLKLCYIYARYMLLWYDYKFSIKIFSTIPISLTLEVVQEDPKYLRYIYARYMLLWYNYRFSCHYYEFYMDELMPLCFTLVQLGLEVFHSSS